MIDDLNFLLIFGFDFIFFPDFFYYFLFCYVSTTARKNQTQFVLRPLQPKKNNYYDFFLNSCVYPHRSRELLSPVCGIFTQSALGPLWSRSHNVHVFICPRPPSPPDSPPPAFLPDRGGRPTPGFSIFIHLFDCLFDRLFVRSFI